MDVTRAKAILSTKDKVDVEFDGVPVWIESIDEDSNTATVHAERNHDMWRTVKINELQEKS